MIKKPINNPDTSNLSPSYWETVLASHKLGLGDLGLFVFQNDHVLCQQCGAEIEYSKKVVVQDLQCSDCNFQFHLDLSKIIHQPEERLFNDHDED